MDLKKEPFKKDSVERTYSNGLRPGRAPAEGRK